jgi:hypothetical protein
VPHTAAPACLSVASGREHDLGEVALGGGQYGPLAHLFQDPPSRPEVALGALQVAGQRRNEHLRIGDRRVDSRAESGQRRGGLIEKLERSGELSAHRMQACQRLQRQCLSPRVSSSTRRISQRAIAASTGVGQNAIQWPQPRRV